MLLYHILKNAGYRDLLTAASAHDAFLKLDLDHAGANSAKIDLILMDIKMPNTDGVETCRRIKAVEAFQSIPIIVVTARNQKEFLQAAFAAGVEDYIRKPVEQVELLTRIKSSLQLKQETETRKSWEMELTKTIAELDRALNDIATLQQLIPVCPCCMQPPSTRISESALSSYIQTHLDAKFKDAVCSRCTGL
ncbi:MAG: response regulator [Nitrospira sp.]|nr:response regulator [Nitrospira sp.]